MQLFYHRLQSGQHLAARSPEQRDCSSLRLPVHCGERREERRQPASESYLEQNIFSFLNTQ